jgi:hypothetical protein
VLGPTADNVGRHKHVYLPLNRNYKPLGQTSRQRVRYEDYVDQAMIFLFRLALASGYRSASDEPKSVTIRPAGGPAELNRAADG